MQVNFNPSVGQSRPNFKALKSIKFEGEALQNCARAQKELLTIFDHPKLKNLFKKYDGQVLFIDKVKNLSAYSHTLSCQIEIFGCQEKEFSKMKSKYIAKAKEANVSTNRIKNAIYPYPQSKTVYLCKSAWQDITDKIKDVYIRSQGVVKSVNETLGSADGEDVILNKILNEYKGNINIFFDKILKEEIKLKKESYEEVIAKDEVANKLKELLGE